MKEIELTQSKVTIVDDEDYEWLNQWNWSCNGLGYAQRAYKTDKGWQPITMHRVIMNAPPGMEVDHINHDGLDNRRCNLRLCKHSQNLANRPAQKNNTSGYKGIYWNKRTKRWISSIQINGKVIYLGCHKNIEDAHQNYEIKIKKLLGEFAYQGK